MIFSETSLKRRKNYSISGIMNILLLCKSYKQFLIPSCVYKRYVLHKQFRVIPAHAGITAF